MLKKQLLAGTALLALLTATASAQYTGPGAPTGAALARTVAEVLEKPVDDQKVELTGVLVRQINRDTFLFRDATGEIEAEIDREDFPDGQPVSPDTRVVIHGEVDTRLMRAPEIDVDRVRVVPADAG